jgi:predicted Zn finger-like uncharacterized protein
VDDPAVSAKKLVRKLTVGHFNCPHCNALYHVARAEAGPAINGQEVTCHACGGPLHAREGKFVLKYFLLRKPARPDPRARKGSQRYVRPN